jgi:hypothetical protein
MATVRNQVTELMKQYLTARKLPIVANTRWRGLFRFDPFIKQWLFKTFDDGALEGDFTSQRVPLALQQD